MSVTRTMMFNAYSGAVAAVTAVVAHKIVDSLWSVVTGEEPPQPNDPTVPAGKAFAWVLANAAGIGHGGAWRTGWADGEAEVRGPQGPGDGR